MAERMLPMVQPERPTGAPPVFARIGIVGLGLIGGSIALAARQKWPRGLVVGVDSKDVLEKAMVLHAIDVAADDLIVLREVDLVILAAPVCQNLALLDELADAVTGPAVVTDVGSTKRAIVDRARQLPPHLSFVGGHPLGGAARQGIEYARPDLFAGRPWLFTPKGDGSGEAVEKLFAMASGLGAEPRIVDPDEHDRLLAYISHLPQVVASALMHVVGEAAGEEGLALSGRGLADTTRLASSPAGIWQDIARTNGDQLGPALDDLVALLQQLRTDLDVGETLERVFESSATWKARLPVRSGRTDSQT